MAAPDMPDDSRGGQGGNMRKGLYISFEGCEGSGKGTIIAKIIPWLKEKGLSIFNHREPGGGPLSEKIRALLIDPNNTINSKAEFFLFSANRAQDIEDLVKPHLKNGDMILSDRTFDASVVYQGYAGGLGIDKLKEISLFAIDNTVADYTFLLVTKAEVALERVRQHNRVESKVGELDRIEAKGLEYHKKVYDGYCNLAKTDNRFVLIDTSDISLDQVYDKVKAVFEEKIIPEFERKKCKKLTQIFSTNSHK